VESRDYNTRLVALSPSATRVFRTLGYVCEECVGEKMDASTWHETLVTQETRDKRQETRDERQETCDMADATWHMRHATPRHEI